MPTDIVNFQVVRCWPEDEHLATWSVTPQSGIPVRADGPCPQCGHLTSGDIGVEVVGGGQSGTQGQPDARYVTRVFNCACGQDHPDNSGNGHLNCGRWWLASVRIAEVGEGGRVRACDGDETLLKAALALQDQLGNEEQSLRSSAEKWVAAVAGLLALFGLSGVVFGKDALTGLSLVAGGIAGVASLLALFLGAGGMYFSYKAAYGWPVTVDVSDNVKLRRWYDDRRNNLGKCATEMKRGVKLAIASVALLALACGIVWFAPREPTEPLVVATLVDDVQLCGQLLDGTDSSIVRIKGTDGLVSVALFSQLRSIRAVRECRT